MGFLSGLTGGDVGKNTIKALNSNNKLLTGFDTTGNSIIDTGEGKSADAINSGIAGYEPWYGTGSAANTMYADALGLNGTSGTATAQSAYETSPGYQFQLDQGTQAALRGASAAGMLNSGNTLTALSQYGQGLAKQDYGSWLDRLNGVSGQGLTAAGGQQQGDTSLANLYQSGTDNRLGLENTVTQGKMGVNTQIGQLKDQQAAAQSSFFGNLLGGGLSLGTKALTGGLF